MIRVSGFVFEFLRIKALMVEFRLCGFYEEQFHSSIHCLRSHDQEQLKMKILQSTRESLAKLGITSSQSIQKYPYNVKIVAYILWFALMTLSEILFIVIEAETVKDYVAILNSSLTLIITYIEFLLHVWRMKQLFEFIVNFEDLIQKSE